VSVWDESAAYPLDTFERTRAWWGDMPHSQSANPPPCPWPLSCPRRGFEVVRAHRAFVGTRNGSPMYSTNIHHFEAPRESLLGRGSLGFFQHRIWNRERGSETVRAFQHAVADPFGATDYPPWMVFLFGGSLFYPGSEIPSFEYTVTPRLPAPSDVDLASTSPAPGLADGASVPVRVVSTERTFELRSNPAQSQLTRLPATTTVIEVDNAATLDLSTAPGTPRFTGVDTQGGGERRKTTTTYLHDVLGNPISITTEVRGAQGSPVAATRRVETTYVSCPGPDCPVVAPDTWITGLPIRIATSDFDADDAVLPAPPARVLRTTYDALGRPSEIRANAAGTDYPSCAAGNPNPESCETGSTSTTVAYTAFGNVGTVTHTAIDNPTPRTTTTSWDAHGVYPTMTVDAAGIARTTLLHPGFGVPVVAIDENTMVTTTKYDGFGRQVSRSGPGQPEMSWTYIPVVNGSSRGMRVDASSQDGRFEVVTTDELAREIQTEVRGFDVGQTILTTSEYDTFGNLVVERRPALTAGAPATTRSFDRLDRETEELSPVGVPAVTTYTMFSTTHTDPEGHVTYVHRDLEDRVVESGHLIGNSPYGEVSFTYGVFDQVTGSEDAHGNVATRSYDGFGRLWSVVDPDTGTSTFHYDGFGDITSKTVGADTSTHTYDTLGRLLVTIDSQGGVASRSYDIGTGAKGRLVSATSADGVSTNVTYDALGRAHQVTQTIDATSHSVIYRYDDFGRLRHVFYPEVAGFDRFTVGYTYNDHGYLSYMSDASWCEIDPGYTTPPGCLAPVLWRVEARDAWLGLTQARFGNNQVVIRDFNDNTGRLELVSSAGVTVEYDYDDDGLLLQRKEGDRVEDFVHDELHRLRLWTIKPPKDHSPGDPPTVTTEYRYTELGNLYQVKRGGNETFFGTFTSNKPHQLAWSSVGGTYSYDERGRQETGGGRTTAWNDHDLPVSMTTNGVTRTFRYDAFGERAKRSEPGSVVTYVGELYEHRVEGADSRHTFYVHGESGVVAQVDYEGTQTTTRYVVADPLGSMIMVEEGSTVVERNYFDPFGGRVDSAGAPATDPDPSTSLGFTGHEDDGGDVTNMQGRIYDRAQYRFLTPDPVITHPLFGQAHNPYSYVYNSPLALVDPSGFSVQSAPKPTGAEAASAPISGEPIAPPQAPKGPAAPTTTAKCEPVSACAQAAATIPASGTTTDDSGASATQGESSAAAPSSDPPEWTINGASGGPGYLPEDAADYSGDGFEESGLLLAAPVLAYVMGPWLFGSTVGRFAIADLATVATWEGHSADSNNAPVIPGPVAEGVISFLGKGFRWGGKGVRWGVNAAKRACRGGVCRGIDECFAAGTPVLTPDGEKPIDEVKAGESVLAYDPTTGTTTTRRVVRTYVRDGITLELTLRVDDGPATALRVTAEHPFLRCDGTFIGAAELAAGDCVVTARSTGTVVAVGAPTTAEPVFNFEVEVDHTYLVGAEGYVVHNVCGSRILIPRRGRIRLRDDDRWLVPLTDKHRGIVYGRQGGLCAAPGCGVMMTRTWGPHMMHMDHPNPFSRYGAIDPLDAQGLCATCNIEKGSMEFEDWVWMMLDAQ
jgi:RHS repeat-associated protein